MTVGIFYSDQRAISFLEHLVREAAEADEREQQKKCEDPPDVGATVLSRFDAFGASEVDVAPEMRGERGARGAVTRQRRT